MSSSKSPPRFFVHTFVYRPFVAPQNDAIQLITSTSPSLCSNPHHNYLSDPNDLQDTHRHCILGFYDYESIGQFGPFEPFVTVQQQSHVVDLSQLNRAFVLMSNERLGKMAMIQCAYCQRRIKASGAFSHVLIAHNIDHKYSQTMKLRRCHRLVCYCENIFTANDALALIDHIWRCAFGQQQSIEKFLLQQADASNGLLCYRRDASPMPFCTKIERNYCAHGCDAQAHISVQNFSSVFLPSVTRGKIHATHMRTVQEWYGSNRPFQ